MENDTTTAAATAAAAAASTDDTSIKPVSSLRSKFENLANDQAPPTPTQQRSSPQAASSNDGNLHPNSTIQPRASRDSLTSRPRSTAGSPQPPSTPFLRQPTPPPPRQRPASMFVLPAKAAERPTVSVEPPRSPSRQFGMVVTSATPPLKVAQSSSPSSASEASHSRTPSRVTTPALEARMSAFLQASHSSDAPSDVATSPSFRGEPKPRPTGPPPVNRAGKPKLAHMPQTPVAVSDPVGGLVAEPNNIHEDKISPFNTPPSSADSSATDQPPPLALSQQSKPRLTTNTFARHSYFPPVSTPVARNPPPRPLSIQYESHSASYPPPLEPSRPHYFASTRDEVEETPELPPRHVRTHHTGQTGRTSPVRQPRIPARRSNEILRRSSATVESTTSHFLPPPKRVQPSALSLGFDRTPAHLTTTPVSAKPPAPAIPAPRRSMETRRESTRPDLPLPPPPPARADDYEDPPITTKSGVVPVLSEFPDASRANRRPPQFPRRPWEISTGYETRLFAVCGEFVCTTGFITRVWSLRTGESCLTLAHGDNVKATALAFKPTPDAAAEGRRLWLGTSIGEIHEIDISTQTVVHTKPNAHPRREVVKLFRHGAELWSLDDEGKLHVWPPGEHGMPSLDSTPRSFRVSRGHSCSVIAGSKLWLASGKDIRVYKPSATSEAAFHVLERPLCQESAGDVTSATTMSGKPDLIYFGHSDGKVSIYNKRDYSCVGLVNVSPYKVSSLAGAGDYLWAGFNTGMIYVYDTSTTPWQVLKDWPAHEKPVCSIITDHQSMWKMDRLQVISLGFDNTLRVWDGMLEDDWMATQMQEHDDEYCQFEEMSVGVMTWNAGACKPSALRNNPRDDQFLRDYLAAHEPADVLVFGFQELVDLEDKKVTAKSFFKSKKKDPAEQEHMSHQYRAWRDHLTRCLEDFMPTSQPYSLLHTTSMVGLFSCVFVRSAIRTRISQVQATEIKRGMGGLHGNKGALIIRMILDDSSICLVNCHLAAGQTQTVNRNNDIAAILESECLPEAVTSNIAGTFVRGGDGSMILDHEICILNGDLNYRIDAMPRDTVVRAVKDKNLTKLLERDQLLLSRRKNPGFRLRVFQEMPITFAPTYKYNVGTDDYDSSEKKRAPAWCDRVLFRGLGRVKGEEYRRWDVRVSDHRPVSARLKMRVKKIDERKRNKVFAQQEVEFDTFRMRVARDAKLDYLTNVLGLPEHEALALLKA